MRMEKSPAAGKEAMVPCKARLADRAPSASIQTKAGIQDVAKLRNVE